MSVSCKINQEDLNKLYNGLKKEQELIMMANGNCPNKFFDDGEFNIGCNECNCGCVSCWIRAINKYLELVED